MKTSFSNEALIDIVATYDLGRFISSMPFEQGNDQTNLLVVTENGKFAFRYYEKRSVEYVKFEIELLDFLSGRQFPCPVPVVNKNGEVIGDYQGKPFALFTYMQGEHSDDENNFRAVARSAGKLHSLTLGYEPGFAEAREAYDAESCWASARKNAAAMTSREEAGRRLDWLRGELDGLHLPDSLPKGICHGDTNPSNFLYVDGRISAVLDFDQASYTYLLYDVANLIYWWSLPNMGELDMGKTRVLVAKYQEVRRLNEDERAYLFDMLKLVILVGVGWFIHDDDDFANCKRKVAALNVLGRDTFHDALFG